LIPGIIFKFNNVTTSYTWFWMTCITHYRNSKHLINQKYTFRASKNLSVQIYSRICFLCCFLQLLKISKIICQQQTIFISGKIIFKKTLWQYSPIDIFSVLKDIWKCFDVSGFNKIRNRNVVYILFSYSNNINNLHQRFGTTVFIYGHTCIVGSNREKNDEK
jgi:hypothetical protein